MLIRNDGSGDDDGTGGDDDGDDDHVGDDNEDDDESPGPLPALQRAMCQL